MLRGCTTLILVLLLGWAAAQTGSHTITTRIPNYIGLKIVDDTGNISMNPRVVFDFESNPTDYIDAVMGSGVLAPTSVSNFADVQVAVRQGTWRIWVGALQLTYNGSDTGTGLALSDIRVVRGAVSGLTPDAITIRPGGSINANWSLSNSWQRIALDSRSTNGWRSLGFNGLDYTLSVQGDESPGQYTTVVYYLLTNP